MDEEGCGRVVWEGEGMWGCVLGDAGGKRVRVCGGWREEGTDRVSRKREVEGRRAC